MGASLPPGQPSRRTILHAALALLAPFPFPSIAHAATSASSLPPTSPPALLPDKFIFTPTSPSPSPPLPPVSDIDPSITPPPTTDRVYLDLSVDGSRPQRLMIALYGTVTPRAVANFKALARRGFAGTRVYRVVPGLTVQLGDVLRNGGKSGEAAEGGVFAADNFRVMHTVPGMVSMVGGGKCDSRFFVNTRRGDSRYLDGRYCAFGRVEEGLEVLYEVEKKAGTGAFTRLPKVVVERCGVVGEKGEGWKEEEEAGGDAEGVRGR